MLLDGRVWGLLSDGRGRALLSDVELVGSQVVHEGLNQEVSGEVEHQAEGDGDG